MPIDFKALIEDEKPIEAKEAPAPKEKPFVVEETVFNVEDVVIAETPTATTETPFMADIVPETPITIEPEIQEAEIVTEIPKKEEKHELATFVQSGEMILPSKKEVDAKYEILEYIKNKVVSKKEDYENINGKPYLLASGTAKFINYFKLKVTYPHREIIEDDYGQHCEFICRVEAPWGQVVESYGTASMNTMKLKKTRHNMVALAETRARTRAVRIIMGFKEPSYAEMHGNETRL